MGYIAGIGACNADIIGKSKNKPVMRDSNPGFMHVNPGGVTRNILENASRLGLDCRLYTAVGDDAFGDMALRETRSAGVDTSRALRLAHTPTSTYCAVLEDTGDMFIALSDMRILEHVSDAYLEEYAGEISGAAAVVLDPSLPVRAIDKVLEVANGAPVFADPVSTSYAGKLEGRAGRFFMLKPNRIELGILSHMPVETEKEIRLAAEALVEMGCARVYVTLGASGCACAQRGGYIRMKLPPVQAMANATGAGDAFTAAAVYGYVKKLDARRTVELCLASGFAAISSEKTVNEAMSIGLLEQILSENPPVLC